MSSSDDDGSEENVPIREEMDDGERVSAFVRIICFVNNPGKYIYNFT